MDQLNGEQINEVVNILQLAVGDTPLDRRAFLVMALVGTNILPHVELTGPSAVFTPNLVNVLLNHGEIERGKHALWAVLEHARKQLGIDDQERIDALRPKIENLSAYRPSATARLPHAAKAAVKKPRGGEVLERPSGGLTAGVAPARPLVARPPLQLSATQVLTKVSPLELARDYVDRMTPVPPAAPQFWMSPCLVSNQLYYHFVSSNRYWVTGDNNADRSYLKHWFEGRPRDDQRDLPITNISFRAAMAFAFWLSQLTSNKVRLPTLKEWHVAVSAQRPGWFKEELNAGRVNYFSTAGHLHSIDAFEPNPYGIRDLLGQAFDMCFMDAALSKPAIVGGCHYQTEAQLRATLDGEEIKSDIICPSLASFRCVRISRSD